MKFFGVIFFLLFFIYGNSQNPLSENFSDHYIRYGARYFSGFIIAHAKDVENTAGSRPYGIELEYSKRHLSEDVWNLCRCYPTTGFSLAFKNYDNEVLGYGFHAAYFVHYHFLQNVRINPVLRGTAGAELNTNPYHSIRNPDNRSYSYYLNFSLQLALMAEIRISDNLFLDLGMAFNHISNGGIKQPNRGINWPSFGMGMHYTPGFYPEINRSEKIPPISENEKWFNRINVYFSAHSKTFDEKERFLILGSDLLKGFRVNNLNSLLVGFEWNFDNSLKREIEFEEFGEKNANRVSVFTGHEFTMGDFRFSQILGIYVYDKLKPYDLIYHKWGIFYRHNSGILAGIELKAHKHVAEFVCLKLGFEF